MSRAAHAVEYRALYYEWEGAHWAVAQIDFGRDAADLETLPWKDALVAQVVAMKAIVRVLPEALVALADAAPHEEQQVFLTAHMADAARETVLFDTFLTGAAAAHSHRRVAASVEELSREISRRSREVRRDDVAAIARAAADVTLLEESVLSPWQGVVHGALERAGALPGLRAGLSHVRADHDRHARFAARFLDDLTGSSDALANEDLGARFIGGVAAGEGLFDGAPFEGSDLVSAARERRGAGA